MNNNTKYNDLLDKLTDYCKDKEFVPMHMPGGKRNSEFLDGALSMPNPYEIDITEIDGFDNLHNSEALLLDARKRAARLFGADETFFLINGSTAGILTAICAATKKKDTILVARNCHVSVYNAIMLNELNPVYIVPQCDSKTGIYEGIRLEDIKAHFEKAHFEKAHCDETHCEGEDTDIKCVVITSPTYEGYALKTDCTDATITIGSTDAAHGAHLNFSEAFPESAVKAGADIVINSIHKTLPSLTQTALLHVNKGLVDVSRVIRYWNIFQSTSPSYILIAGIDRCLSILDKHAHEIFPEYISNVLRLRTHLSSELKNIKLLETDDISKIILVCEDGNRLFKLLLERYNIQLEMASFKYVIAMTSVADKPSYYERLERALTELDREFKKEAGRELDREFEEEAEREGDFSLNKKFSVACAPAEAYARGDEEGFVEIDVNSCDICGRISLACVLLYPPGMPVVNAGEIITEEIVDVIKKAKRAGLEVIGLTGEGKIRCLR